MMLWDFGGRVIKDFVVYDLFCFRPLTLGEISCHIMKHSAIYLPYEGAFTTH